MKVIHLVSNHEWGGGERYVLDLAQSQQRAGMEVVIACRGVEEVISRFAAGGLRVVELPLKGYLDFSSGRRLARLIGQQPAVIHAHNFHDAFIALRAKRRSGANTGVVMTRHLVRRAKTSWRYRSLYRDLDALICVSEEVRRAILESNPPISPAKVHVIHNSIHLPAYKESSSSPDVIMAHGRLDPEKGFSTLIEALALLRDLNVKVNIAGRGTAAAESELRLLAERRGVSDNITWLGFRDDIHDLIERCAIGVVPSVRPEAFGLTAIEYMAHGRPVVCSRIGGIPEAVVDGRDGLLVPPGDPAALAQAIRTLLEDDQLRHRLGSRAAEDFRDKFSYPVFFGKITALYNSLFA